MSDKDLIKKYEIDETSFVATEDDLKSIQNVAVTPQKVLTDTRTEQQKKIDNKSPDIEINPIKFEAIQPTEAPKTNDELTTDYQYVRTNLYSITERSIEALNNLVQIADQSQHPRAYEVVSLLVNTIANAQKDLMTIHREKAKIEGVVNKNKPEVVNNNLFVGNTAQLDEIIKNMTKKHDDNE